MLGFRIIVLALVGLVKKLHLAVATSILPGLLIAASFMLLDELTPQLVSLGSSPTVWIVAFFACTLPAVSWFLVSWSRIAILNEKPTFLPPVRNQIWPKALFALSILTAGCAGFYIGLFQILDLVLGNVSLVSDYGIAISFLSLGITILAYVASTWVIIRLLTYIPAIAVSDPMSVQQSWRQTADYTATIIVIALSFFGIMVGMLFLPVALLPNTVVAASVLMGGSTIISIVILTELYSYIRAQNDVVQVFE